MGTTDPSDPKMSEYSEVVVRQSEKLKRLIEDLVEASKASTGNLEIVPAPLDCCTFVSQTAGEYKEKVESAGLTLITSAPDEPVLIMADGRRMMRIYDNLMNNICKYAQPGTRVYLNLEVINGQAVTTFKNTSSAELNITADELVERFNPEYITYTDYKRRSVTQYRRKRIGTIDRKEHDGTSGRKI